MPGETSGNDVPMHYDHNWKFKHDWVRDGILWFIPPATQITAGTRKYNQTKLNYVRDRLKWTSKQNYLQDILNKIILQYGSVQDKIEAIIYFVQDATWHNPIECPFEEDEWTVVSEAHELLELHDARCWHTAEILRQLFVQGGWDSRVTFLPSEFSDSVQAINEVCYDGTWHFVDANYFKNHIVIRTPDGLLPTLEWLRGHPHYIDSFPGGWIYPVDYLKNASGRFVTGQFHVPFPEAEDTWGCDPYYCYYLGENEKFPPTIPTGLTIERYNHDTARIEWISSKSKTSESIFYNLQVRRKRDNSLIADIKGLDATYAMLRGLELKESYVVEICSTDEHIFIEPSTWYPSRKLLFQFE